MSRYFAENDNESVKTEVFTITSADAKKAHGFFGDYDKRKKFKSESEEMYTKKKRKGYDKFPGKAPINSQHLEKHQYSDGFNPKNRHGKYAQKMAAKRENDRRQAHEIAARTELLLDDDAGFLEPDSDDGTSI